MSIFLLASAPAPAAVSIWSTNDAPNVLDVGPDAAVELGVKFRSDVDGSIIAIRYFKSATNAGPHVGNLWTIAGGPLASVEFTNETASGWQQATLTNPVAITAGTLYVASYHCPSGHWSVTPNGLLSEASNPPLRAPAADAVGGNGVYGYGSSGFPSTPSAGNYWVDVVFEPAMDTNAPQLISTIPAAGQTGVSPLVAVTVNFSEAMDASTISTNTIALHLGSNQLVLASASYDAAAFKATLTPDAALLIATNYTVSVLGGANGVSDVAGNRMTNTVTWSFSTVTNLAASVWTAGEVPAIESADDPAAYELGMKFRTAINGYILGVRFYKGTNNFGPHTGSLWNSAGTRLASIEFTNETASGWQYEAFAAAVPVFTNTTYVVSYFVPSGGYAANLNYFTNGVDNYPLRALADGEDGGNGLLRFNESGFPTLSINKANYWVDVLFDKNPPPDTSAPVVTTVTPVAGASFISLGGAVTAAFNEPMNPATITTNTLTLRSSANTLVAATVSYNSNNFTATLKPNAVLAGNESYTARVQGGVTGVADIWTNRLAATFEWSFTTAPFLTRSLWSDTNAPSLPFNNDGDSITVGTKFQSSRAGFISGIRYYRGNPASVGTHVGALWTSGGELLRFAIFTNEAGAGWQTQFFDQVVPIESNTTYVASLYTTDGGYAVTPGYFTNGFTNAPLRALANGEEGGNGVFTYGAPAFPSFSANGANYWVDPLFRTNTAPVATNQVVTMIEDAVTNIVLRAGDVESTNLTYSILTGPTNGALGALDSQTGAVSYTANLNYSGPDAFRFTVSDGFLLSTGLVSIAVISVDDAPAAINQSVAALEDTPTNIVLTVGDVDATAKVVFSETLALTASAAPDEWALGGTNLTKAGAVASDDGTNSYVSSSITINRTQRFVVADPTSVGSGHAIDYVTVRATCARGGGQNATYVLLAILGASTNSSTTRTASAGFVQATVNFTNKPGGGSWTLADVQNMDVAIRNTQTRDVRCTQFDVVVNYSIPAYATNLSFTIIEPPSHGSLLNLNTNTGAVSYMPATNYHGPDSFLFRADMGSLLSTGVVNITVIPVNDAPVANDQLVATRRNTLTNIVLGGSDVDNVSLVYSILDSPDHGLLLNLDTETGAVAYAPASNYLGSDEFTFTASDGSLLATGKVSIAVNLVNQAPILTEQGDRQLWQFTTLTVTNTATDDGLPQDTLEYALTGPVGAMINTSGVITWQTSWSSLPGSNLFKTVVSDGELSATNEFWGVLQVPPQPVISGIEITNPYITVKWFAVEGLTYALEYVEAVGQTNWIRLPGIVTSAGVTASKSDAFTNGASRYYRVVTPVE